MYTPPRETRELLFSLTKKDFEITFFKGSGKGGQNRNKVETGVRIKHPESGAIAEACEERSQAQNRRIAFERLVNSPKFKTWHRLKTAAVLMGINDIKRMIAREVDEAMRPQNLRCEVESPTGWKIVNPNQIPLDTPLSP